MSFFRRILERLRPEGAKDATDAEATSSPESTDDAAATTQAPADSQDAPLDAADTRIERLALFGTPHGPDEREALALLAALRESPLESDALAALTAVASRRPLGDDIAAAAAKVAVDRGEIAIARRLLAGVSSPTALLLAADLAEESGEPTVALAMVERVLARAYETPGARERHARLARATGASAARATARSASRDETALSAHVDAPYVLRREIARGGAATVYEADDRTLERRVALKVYHDAREDREQLLGEARTATTLAGPRIIRIFDADPESGWIVLELFPRGSLKDALRRADPDLLELAWLPSLIEALHEVHARGFVHLDVKPGNVLVRDADAVVLADFGTARPVGATSPPGSLGYVSPERLGGAPASPADDVYGLGRVLEDALAQMTEPPPRLVHLARRLVSKAVDRPADLRALADWLAREAEGAPPVSALR